MPAEHPWTNDPVVLTYARVLREVATHGTSEVVEASEVAALLTVAPEQVGAAFDALKKDGLVTVLPAGLSDTFTSAVVPLPDSKARVSEWDAAATTSAQRRACRSAILAWLDSSEGDGATSTDEFNGATAAHFAGVPFDMQTVTQTARELKKIGLIGGTATSGGPVLRPALTNQGTTVLDQFGGDVSLWQAGPSAGSTSITVTGSQNVNVANLSPGAQQTAQNVTAARDAVRDVADALDGMLASRSADLELAPADLARAFALVPQLRVAAAEVDTDPDQARRRLGALRDVFKAGSGSALGVGIVALADRAIPLLTALI